MTNDPLTNLLRLIDTDRLEEAREFAEKDAAAGNSLALLAYEDLKQRIDSDSDWVNCDCSECNDWDGHSRRCFCGNRRVYWEYEKPSRDFPNGYFTAACY